MVIWLRWLRVLLLLGFTNAKNFGSRASVGSDLDR
jgi:hypothetical protein